MRNSIFNWWVVLCLCLITLMSQSVFAKCQRISTSSGVDWDPAYVNPLYGKTAVWEGASLTNRGILNLSVVNITDESFQPNGTLLQSSTVPFTTYGQEKGYDPEQVLFRCDATDDGKLYEIYSVNGGEQYGGYHEDGAAFGVTRGYATYVQNMAIRVKNNSTGQYFAGPWQYRALLGLDRDEKNRILVKAKNFTDITVELFRIGTIRGKVESHLKPYSFNQPSAYIAFGGPGLDYPDEGVYHITHRPGYYKNWPGNISLYNQLYTRRTSGCAVTRVTPYVYFAPLTMDELHKGITRESTISINYRCEKTANINAGPAVNGIAVAFKIGTSNYQVAKSLGFMNLDAATYLLSDNYGSNDIAKGVGVKLVRSDGIEQPFLNFEGRTSLAPQYNASKDGWRHLFGNKVGEADGSIQYSDSYQVTFGKLPGMTPTTGRFYAKAEVLIRVQ